MTKERALAVEREVDARIAELEYVSRRKPNASTTNPNEVAMNEHHQPRPLEEELAPFIGRVRQDIENGARPSDVANWVHSHRLGTLKVMFIFMKATGVSLGDAKRMDRWWDNGVSDPDGFDQEARRLLAELAAKGG